MAEKIAISKLRRDGGTQFRTDLHKDAVADYAAALTRGEKLPPIVVFYDGTNYWLADGYHTTKAHEEIKTKEIDADIRAGTQRDARLYAATKANRGHGLRFTNDEKRARVKALLDDAEWSAWTNPVIAAECGVSYEMVRGLRPESTNFADSEAPKTRKGKDGKNYPVGRAKKTKPEVEKPPTPPKAQPKVTYDRGAGGSGDDCRGAPDDGIKVIQQEPPTPEGRVPGTAVGTLLGLDGGDKPPPEPRPWEGDDMREQKPIPVEYRQPSAVPSGKVDEVAAGGDPVAREAIEDARAAEEVEHIEGRIKAFLTAHPGHVQMLEQSLMAMTRMVGIEAKKRK